MQGFFPISFWLKLKMVPGETGTGQVHRQGQAPEQGSSRTEAQQRGRVRIFQQRGRPTALCFMIVVVINRPFCTTIPLCYLQALGYVCWTRPPSHGYICWNQGSGPTRKLQPDGKVNNDTDAAGKSHSPHSTKLGGWCGHVEWQAVVLVLPRREQKSGEEAPEHREGEAEWQHRRGGWRPAGWARSPGRASSGVRHSAVRRGPRRRVCEPHLEKGWEAERNRGEGSPQVGISWAFKKKKPWLVLPLAGRRKWSAYASPGGWPGKSLLLLNI